MARNAEQKKTNQKKTNPGSAIYKQTIGADFHHLANTEKSLNGT